MYQQSGCTLTSEKRRHCVIRGRQRVKIRNYMSSIISYAGKVAESPDQSLPPGFPRIVHVSPKRHRQASHSPGQLARLHEQIGRSHQSIVATIWYVMNATSFEHSAAASLFSAVVSAGSESLK
jgi:hypothetical protein